MASHLIPAVCLCHLKYSSQLSFPILAVLEILQVLLYSTKFWTIYNVKHSDHVLYKYGKNMYKVLIKVLSETIVVGDTVVSISNKHRKIDGQITRILSYNSYYRDLKEKNHQIQIFNETPYVSIV